MSILSITKTLVKSVFHGPYTAMYPIKKRDAYENTKGSIDITMSECIFCGSCQRNCPTNAIVIEKAKTSWSIDRLKCIQCRYCVEVCPKDCLSMNGQYSAPVVAKEVEEYTNA